MSRTTPDADNTDVRIPLCMRTAPFPCFRRNLVVQNGPDEAAANEGEEDLQAEDELHHAGARHDDSEERDDCNERGNNNAAPVYLGTKVSLVSDRENITAI